MQTIRASGVRPFTASRPTARAVAPRAAQLQQHAALRRAQRSVSVFAAAVDDLEDVSDIEDAPMTMLSSGSGQDLSVLPTEKVKLRIRMRGYNIGILQDAAEQVCEIAAATGARIHGPVYLPTKKKVYCVLRSPHVNKDSREHFEIRVHHRLVDLSNLSAQTVQAMMEWVPPSGLEVDCTVV
jgi:small subunit ribosomal protein S10